MNRTFLHRAMLAERFALAVAALVFVGSVRLILQRCMRTEFPFPRLLTYLTRADFNRIAKDRTPLTRRREGACCAVLDQ
jgi:hypothetical protein